MKADVHIFAVVRVKVAAVEGADDHECIDRAVETAGLDRLFGQLHTADGPGAEYADEITEYLVDPYDAAGRPDLERARRYRDAAHVDLDAADDAPVHAPHVLTLVRDTPAGLPTANSDAADPSTPHPG